MVALHTLLFALLQAQSAFGELNVYGQPMSTCGADHLAGCTYSAMDAGAHQVCVTQLPAGFSTQTGQGSWSDEFTGQPWCICIWAYSNYILQSKSLPLKCTSVPAKVLEEQYSLDKFKQCGSMSSTEGCGAEDIRRSIQSLCQQCDMQAGTDQAWKAALKQKCDAILTSAPAAPFAQLYEKQSKTKNMAQRQSVTGAMWGILAPLVGMVGCAVLGLSVAMVGCVCSSQRDQRETLYQQGTYTFQDGIASHYADGSTMSDADII